MDRRSMLKAAGSAAALTVLGIPVGAAAAEVTPVPKKKNRKKIQSHDEAAAIRVREAEAACKVTGARPLFMDQIDGATEVTLDRYREMRELIEREKPDLVITHWPIDGHRDHAVCGILVVDAWRRLDRCFELYYFEVMSGTQTQMFHPSDWVDITTTRDRKYKASYCHESQDLKEVMDGWHEPMERFRGIECRCAFAEAFLHHVEPVSLV